MKRQKQIIKELKETGKYHDPELGVVSLSKLRIPSGKLVNKAHINLHVNIRQELNEQSRGKAQKIK